MRKYEMMIIFDEETLAWDQCKSFLYETLKENSVKILEEKDMGIRDLAYEINRKRKGHYYLLQLEAEQVALPELQKVFKIAKHVMRYIIINQEA